MKTQVLNLKKLKTQVSIRYLTLIFLMSINPKFWRVFHLFFSQLMLLELPLIDSMWALHIICSLCDRIIQFKESHWKRVVLIADVFMLFCPLLKLLSSKDINLVFFFFFWNQISTLFATLIFFFNRTGTFIKI
jgi:hypothetical protein